MKPLATEPKGLQAFARRFRLAYVVSHPIQYQAGLLRLLAAQPDIDLLVLFCSDFSVRSYKDEGFGTAVTWDTPLLEGYRHVVLPRLRDTGNPSPTSPIAFGFYRHLQRGLDGIPFDAVWIHGYSTINALHAMLAAKALGLPVLLRAESWLEDRSRSGWKLLVKRGYFRLLRSLVHGVLPIGSRNAAYWRYYFGETFPAFPVPYTVDNHYFAERSAAAAASREDLLRELNVESGYPVILFASKLQERKHCDHLVEAFLQLQMPADRPKPYLLIVGDGEMRQDLERRAAVSGSERIVFAGFRNQSELPRFFELSSVFVLPSRHEAWGLITNEAMASGMPVIVTQSAGCTPDLVQNGVNGFAYPVGDIAALRSALETCLSPGRAQTMGEHSRDIIAGWSYAKDVAGLRAALHHASGATTANLPGTTG